MEKSIVIDPNWVSAIVSIAAFGFSWIAYKKATRNENHAAVFRVTDRLYEIDKVCIEKPGIQLMLKESVGIGDLEELKSGLAPEEFIRLKSYVYLWINTIDEFISAVQQEKQLRKILEYDDWIGYFILRLRHPVFRLIADKEKSLFGAKFNEWFRDNRPQIDAPLTDAEKDMY